MLLRRNSLPLLKKVAGACFVRRLVGSYGKSKDLTGDGDKDIGISVELKMDLLLRTKKTNISAVRHSVDEIVAMLLTELNQARSFTSRGCEYSGQRISSPNLPELLRQ